MSTIDPGFGKSLAQVREKRPMNTVQPAASQGITLDEKGRIPGAAVLAPFTGAAGTLTVTAGGTVAWGSATITPATTLPSSPTDGQEAILTDSTTAPTYMWRLRYNSGASTYKWYFVGGFHKPVVVATAETSSSASYTDLATSGPSFTVPNAGEYLVAAECQVTQSGSGGYQFFSVKIGSASTSDTESVEIGIGANGKGCFSRVQELTCAASDVLKMQYKVSANTHTWANRSLMVLPKRIT